MGAAGNRHRIGKRGIALWTSWVLLMAFALIISTFMYNWIFSYTSGTTEELRERAFNAEGCEDIGISIDSICQNSQTLYMNITNTKNIVVKQLVFRLYDLYEEPQIRRTNITLRPKATELVRIIKQGFVRDVEVIPVTYLDNIEIICLNRMTEHRDIGYCLS
ncbi:hypothetical protein JXB02_04970 [Candidatus Woesearchaeota archaeon]|nr:hypothetical protein [Candidatus Woesearchaeota archaeon]